MTEAAVSFAGNLTDDPEVRSTEGGIARATFRVAVYGGIFLPDPLRAGMS
jgi:single-stranded DNA-binding protein